MNKSKRGQVSHCNTNNTQITLLTTSYSYNANGQLQQMTYPRVKKSAINTTGKLIGLTLKGKTLLSDIMGNKMAQEQR